MGISEGVAYQRAASKLRGAASVGQQSAEEKSEILDHLDYTVGHFAGLGRSRSRDGAHWHNVAIFFLLADSFLKMTRQDAAIRLVTYLGVATDEVCALAVDV